MKSMMNMKEKLAKIQSLPEGVTSPSGHYWCATCKKLFRMESPTCPYMTGMCVNQAIPIEGSGAPSAVAYERFGLFYPKFSQRCLALLVGGVASERRRDLGARLAEAYMDDLSEWRVRGETSPIETVKSFAVFVSGCEVAQRRLDGKLLFVLLDSQNVWPEQDELREVLLAGMEGVAERVALGQSVDLDFIQIVPGKPGRYHCAKCSMYFEFGKARDKVICPLMPQKCMFDPTAIAGSYPVSDLLKIYRITPGLYARLNLAARELSSTDIGQVRASLAEELEAWGFEGTEQQHGQLLESLGLG